ncbi:hypothetical protein M5689_014314 [Euphorbia peplus]|nr:hypothetical protein M5689_014314 [Euphorbia peplus]
MGNCLRRDSAMQWGGDDWGSSSDYMTTSSHDDYEKEEGSSKLSNNKEVKVKISKQQLAELLGRVDMNELSVQQVLAELMNITDSVVSDHNRPWKPNLQTIPE